MKGSGWKHARQSGWLGRNNRKARVIKGDIDKMDIENGQYDENSQKRTNNNSKYNHLQKYENKDTIKIT